MAILNSIRNNFLKTELSRKRISHTVVQTTYPRHIYNLCNYTLFPKQCQQNGLYPPPAVGPFLLNCYVLCFQNHIIFQKLSDRYCFVNGLNLILVDQKNFFQAAIFISRILLVFTYMEFTTRLTTYTVFFRQTVSNIDFCKKISSNTKIKHIYRALFPKIYSFPESRNQILFPAFRNAF